MRQAGFIALNFGVYQKIQVKPLTRVRAPNIGVVGVLVLIGQASCSDPSQDQAKEAYGEWTSKGG